jgi:hypothetical protein
MTRFVTRLTWLVPLVEKELLTFLEHLSTPPVLSGARVTLFLVLCVWFVYVVSRQIHNISVISWQSVLLVGEIKGPGKNHRPVSSHWQTLSHNVVHCMFFYFIVCPSFGHFVVCPSIYRFWLPLWYLQIFLCNLSKHKIIKWVVMAVIVW